MIVCSKYIFMNDIKFVYFDLGGVVVDHIKSLEKIAIHLGIGQDKLVSFFRQHAHDLDRGVIRWDAFGERICLELGCPQKLEAPLSELFVDNLIKIQDTQQLMLKIKKQKIGIGILSNIAEDVFTLTQQKGFIPDIGYDSIVVSARIKVIKPEKEIFDYALQAINIKPQNVLFIDDTAVNIEAAKFHGWNTVLFDTKNPRTSVKLIEDMINGS